MARKPLPSKLAVAAFIFIASTAIFAGWWFLKNSRQDPPAPGPRVAEQPKEGTKTQPQPPGAKEAPAQPQALKPPPFSAASYSADRLFIAGGDLMDLETGKVLVSGFLKGPAPKQIWYDQSSAKFIARYERGFVRYNLDGSTDKELGGISGIWVSDDLALAVYPQNGEIYTADLNWKDFELQRLRRITTTGGFQDGFVLQNIMMMSKKAMVIQNGNSLVRVDLESGNASPVQNALTQARERRSPDGGLVISEQQSPKGKTIFVYDVAKNKVTTADIGTAGLTGTLWLGEKRCCLLINDQILLGYDREKESFAEIMKLPKAFNRIAAPSPAGRFILCVGVSGAGIADLEKKEFIPVNFPPQNLCWIGDETLLMARDTSDSTYRGSWLQPLGGGEAVRVSTEPYAFDSTSSAASVLPLKAAGKVVFGTRSGLFKMLPDGTQVQMLASIPAPALQLLAVEPWRF